ncbi:MAG: tRNA 2-thiouridine(34) synthase MnmA, partial [Prevotella sp.]|nr:tRNA 2-thiouridine(34) synthase MnmA [Prevotella sp.]
MNMKELHQKRVALLLSGGVDSAVALHELVENGVRPDCFYIKIGSEDKDEWDCSMEEDLEMATALCHRYGVTLEIVDC